jgi:anti-sigma regulatory factor (Ser/Thr protein kinase)
VDSRDALRAKSHSTRLPSPGGEAVSATRTVRLRLPAKSSSASILRTELADWLRNSWPADSAVFDLQVACTEVLTVIVSKPGNRSALVVEIEGAVADSTITLTMREFGLCREPGHARGRLEQALSLALIEAMTDTLEIHQHTHGRTFTLRRNM